jgi:triosephosphate isomerase
MSTKPFPHGKGFSTDQGRNQEAGSIGIAERRGSGYQLPPISKPMRKKIIAANWKMNMTVAETVSYLESFRTHVESVNGVEIVIAPPFTAIAKLSDLLGGSQKISLGAQNMYFEMSGAFTGEISPAMLRELFVRFVILGHSERRQIFGETDALINKKVHTALACGLKPIVCVGETLEERDAGRETEILTTQLRGSLAGVPAEKLPSLVIAYEPVWAIGTGRNATPEQAQDAHAHVRKVLAEISDAETANKVRIQYGGSVKPANAATLLSQPDIDGALVGGASLEALGFSEIVKAAVGK